MTQSPRRRRQPASWEKYVKKYVWDDDSTPYFIPVQKLKRYQADKELFIYAFFLATPATLLTAGIGSQIVSGGIYDNLIVGVYAFSVFCAAVYLHFRKNLYAALYTVTAPFAMLLHFTLNGFPSKLHTIEQVGLVIVTLIWLRYTIRVVAIAKAYPGLSSIKKDDNPWSKLSAGGPPPG